MKTIKLLFCCISLTTVVMSGLAGDSTNSIAEIIQFGATNSTLIVSGKFGGSMAGGGGATSRVDIDKVFKTPVDFQTPKHITLFWLTGKSSGFGSLQLTNTYIFFLRPADGGYRDVTDKQPFVEASEANIGVLKSQLKN
jgi:hypothetical protein